MLAKEVTTVSPDPMMRSVSSASPPLGSVFSIDDPLTGPSVMDDALSMGWSFGSLRPLVDVSESLFDVT